MALIAVLWIVAALSILVIGVTATVRQQIQTVGIQRDEASGQALGEAANALVLQQLQVLRTPPSATTAVTGTYAGQPFAVTGLTGTLVERGTLFNQIVPEPAAAMLAAVGTTVAVGWNRSRRRRSSR